MNKTFYVDKPLAECRARQSDPFRIYARPGRNRAMIRITDEDAKLILDWHVERRSPDSVSLESVMQESTKMPTHMLVEEDCEGVVVRGLAPWPWLSEKQEKACKDLERALMECEATGVAIAVMEGEILATSDLMMQPAVRLLKEGDHPLPGLRELAKVTRFPLGRKIADHGRLGWHGNW